MQANKDLLSSSEHLSVPCFELEPPISSLTNQLSHSLFVLTALCNPHPCFAVQRGIIYSGRLLTNSRHCLTVVQKHHVVNRICDVDNFFLQSVELLRPNCPWFPDGRINEIHIFRVLSFGNSFCNFNWSLILCWHSRRTVGQTVNKMCVPKTVVECTSKEIKSEQSGYRTRVREECGDR
jgi:hypothetical protein